MEMQSVIQMKNVEKSFKGFQLDVEELAIPKGFATALIGENGAGKSTLLNILAGIRLDYKGEIVFFDGTMKEEEIRENVAYTGPDSYFLPHWTVKAVAEISDILFGQFHKDQFEQWCKDLGIDKKDTSISKMSDGMKMKTMLAAAFSRDTKCLLLDEPASPLDPLMRDKLCSMIRDYIDEGAGEQSVFFSTHNIADMENVTDYAIIMEQGKVVEQGFVEDLKEKYIMVKGEAEQGEAVKPYLVSFTKNAYGFEGLCLANNLDKLAGFDVISETPSLSQISVGVMKQYTKLAS